MGWCYCCCSELGRSRWVRERSRRRIECKAGAARRRACVLNGRHCWPTASGHASSDPWWVVGAQSNGGAGGQWAERGRGAVEQ